MHSIQVSDNGRFLVYEDGAPFFWLGDTAWELFHRATREEAEYYLEHRRRNGFNVIQAVVLAEFDGLRVPNAYGHVPLIDENPERPNEDYFRHVDDIIKLAADKGLYVGLLPTWGDKVNRAWGTGPVIFDEQSARSYGEFIGARYRNQRNILWILGGDRPEAVDGVDYAPVWRAMAEGIQAGAGDKAFFTYHPGGGRSSSTAFHQDSWLHLNMWQSGHGRRDTPNWELITNDYALTPVKPVLDGEPNYEDHPINPFSRQWKPEYGYFRDHDVRKQAYRAVFAGACGHTYGHHSVWQLFEPGHAPVNYPYCTWRDALARPGAAHMIHLRRLMESRPYLRRIPDQSVLASDPAEGAYHVQATRSSDGSFAMIYIPTADQTVRIDMSRLAASKITASWYDPRRGTTSTIAKFYGASECEFTTPGEGPDWVLLLDSD